MKELIKLTNGKCKYPIGIECCSVNPNKKKPDKVTCNIHKGFACEGNCGKYKIRLKCCGNYVYLFTSITIFQL